MTGTWATLRRALSTLTKSGCAVGDGRESAIEGLEPRTLLAGDLAVALGAETLPNQWATAGDRVGATVVLSNVGDATIRGAFNVDLFLTRRDEGQPESEVLVTTQRLNVSLAPGQTRRLNLRGLVDAGFAPGNYALAAELRSVGSQSDDDDDDSSSGGSSGVDGNPANDRAVSAQTRELAYRFGSFGERTNVRMLIELEDDDYDDDSGRDDDDDNGRRRDDSRPTFITFSMSGPGYGEVTVGVTTSSVGDVPEELRSMLIQQTTAASVARVDIRGDDDVELRGEVVINTPMRAFIAPKLDITRGGFLAQSTIADVQLDDVDSSVIRIEGAGTPMRFRAGQFENVDLQSNTPFTTFTLAEWESESSGSNGDSSGGGNRGGGQDDPPGDDRGGRGNDDSSGSGDNAGGTGVVVSALVAPWINQLTVRGEMESSVRLTSALGPGGTALNRAEVRGDVRGTWTIMGNVGQLNFGDAEDGVVINVNGAIQGLNIRSDFRGTVAAVSIQRFEVRGDVENSTILAGVFLGADNALGGADQNADSAPGGSVAFGPFGSFFVRGKLSNSTVASGFMPAAAGRAAAFNFEQASVFRSINVRGEVENSTFFAQTFPVRAVIDGSSLTTASNPTLFRTTVG